MHLRRRTILLLLDNCEHVIDSCAQLAESLLRACPHVTVLATSREVFGLAAERIFPVPPLSAPGEKPVSCFRDLQPFESARLFIERAGASYPGVTLADGDAPALAAICRQLEGMPLAIELAAARVRALSVSQIASHLQERFTLLAAGSRSGPPRQHSLRAAIDWSYDTLSPDEQALLRRLSVFAGSLIEEAALAVFGESRSPTQVIDLLARLVDKSLVMVAQTGDDRRYRLLDTIKLYAWEKLEQAAEKDECIARYLDFYSNWLEGHWRQHPTPSKALYAAMRRLADPDRDNVLRAISWCATGRVAMGVRIIDAVWPSLARWGALSQLTYWIELVLACESKWDTAQRANALAFVARMERLRGNWSLVNELQQRAVDLARQTGNRQMEAVYLAWQMKHLKNSANFTLALRVFEELMQLTRESGLWPGAEYVYLDAAGALAGLDRVDEAVPLWKRGLREARETGHESSIAEGIAGLGRAALQSGDVTTAEAHFRESVEIAASFRHQGDQILGLEWLAQSATAQGRCERAAILWGVADTARLVLVPRYPCYESGYSSSIVSLRQQMGDAAFAAAYAHGQAMTLEKAVAYALQEET
jgi:predicted ATPase